MNHPTAVDWGRWLEGAGTEPVEKGAGDAHPSP